MSTPGSIVGEQNRKGKSASRNARSRCIRSSLVTWRCARGLQAGEQTGGLPVQVAEERVDPNTGFGGDDLAEWVGASESLSLARQMSADALSR